MKRLYSEWDVGHEGVVFKNKRAALAWLKDNATVQGMIGPDEEFSSLKAIFDSGLMGLHDLKVWD